VDFIAEALQSVPLSWDLIVVLSLTGLAVILFVLEVFRVDLVALFVMATLMLTGIVTPRQGFSGFSNEATITIAAMFVLSAGLRRTGAVNILGDRLADLFEENYWVGMIVMMLGVGFLSAFINNTAVVAVMLPLMIKTAREAEYSVTRVLMPMSFAAMFGGICTLVGTSTNLVVSSVLEQSGMEPLGMFEMTPLGLVLFGLGMIYMLTIGERLMPDRGGPEDDFVESFELNHYVTDLELLPNSELVGEPVPGGWLADDDDTKIIEVFRDNVPLTYPSPAITLQPGDVIRIRGTAEAIRDIEARPAIRIRPLHNLERREDQGDTGLYEAVIAPDSELDHASLRDVEFEQEFTADIVAIRRQQARVVPGRKRTKVFHTDLRDEELRAGDVLLLQCDRRNVHALQNDPSFILVSEIGLPSYRTEKTLPAIGIVAAVVISAALGWWHISVAATAGCVLLVALGIVTIEEAYEDINWEVIFLLGGLLPLGTALQETGGIAILSEGLIGFLGPYGPTAVLSGLYLLAAILTGFMSNQATAILFTPIAIDTAAHMGVDPRPLVVAIAFAASASFLTPVGYQTNTMIYGVGQYRFSDFIRVGTALTLLFWLAATVGIPYFWPMMSVG
jgi:di/tricarboxylate transporter